MALINETRRRLPRQPADWRGTYYFVEDDSVDPGECRVVDISRMGTGVELFGNAPTEPIGHRLAVDVGGPAGGSIAMHMEGVVRNATRVASGGLRLGVEFVNLSATEVAMLDSLEQMQIAW
jgi:hypothetical protein